MIIVTYQPLPTHIKAIVHENSDDSYTIIVNKNLSEEGRKRAVAHEMRHIQGEDLQSDKDVSQVEKSCHSSNSGENSEEMDIYVRDGE